MISAIVTFIVVSYNVFGALVTHPTLAEDIVITHNNSATTGLGQPLPVHQVPQLGQTNFAYVLVRNRGTQPAYNVRVNLYLGSTATGLSWPGDWKLIGFSTIPELPADQTYLTAPVAWNLPGVGSYSMVARLVTPQDLMTVPENANITHNTRGNNNIAWRSLDIEMKPIGPPMLVTLSEFTATIAEKGIHLRWKTALEIEQAKFTIWRGKPLNGTCTNNPLDYDDVKIIAHVYAKNTPVGNSSVYSRIDSDVKLGETYCYLLADTNFSGNQNYHWDFLRSVTLPSRNNVQ